MLMFAFLLTIGVFFSSSEKLLAQECLKCHQRDCCPIISSMLKGTDWLLLHATPRTCYCPAVILLFMVNNVENGSNFMLRNKNLIWWLLINNLSFPEYDENFKLLQRQEFNIPDHLMIHDWAFTDTLYILFANRIKLDVIGNYLHAKNICVILSDLKLYNGNN